MATGLKRILCVKNVKKIPDWESFLFTCLYIVVKWGFEAQTVVVRETRNAVLGASRQKARNFKVFALYGRQKIRKKVSKNVLHSICSMYIIQRLVKCEEAGSYRASG